MAWMVHFSKQMKEMNSKMILLISILLLTACCGQQVLDPEEVFELIWESKVDPTRSIVGSDYVQIWDDYFIWTGDVEEPLKIKYFNKHSGDLEYEFTSNGNVNSSIFYNKLNNNTYVGITGDGVFGFNLENRKLLWEINLSDMNIRFGWNMTLHKDHIYMPVSWMFKQANIEEERMLKIHYLTGEMETVFELKSQDSILYEFSSPVFRTDPISGHDIMYFNNQNWRYDFSPQETAQDMWAVDVETGEVLWCNAKFTPVASNGAIPPVHYGDAIITGGDWSIYSFDAKTGALNWKTTFPEHEPFPIWGTTQHLLKDNRLYVNNGGPNIRCLNADTGELIWHNSTDASNCSPTMTYYQDMLVYTSWGKGSIMVLDAFTGQKIHQERSHNNSTFNTDVIYDEQTDMFFTTDYHYAYGFRIHKPE